MSTIRAIVIEATLAGAMLMTGIATAEAAHAAPVSAVALQAAAQADVKIESAVKIVRSEKKADGRTVTTYHSADEVKVVPGDKLLFINSYNNLGNKAATGFVVNNPVHPAVGFSDVAEDWAVVSVDGGKTFGKLTALTVTVSTATGKATRAAQPSDVTHIRWTFAKPIAAGASGKLQFSGVVK